MTGTQSSTGDFIVTFTPKLNTSGLGGFNWSVANGVTTMSSTCGVLISQSGPAQSVVWKGDGVNNYWDLGSANWTAISSGSATSFSNSDPITFDDTGSASPAINIDTAVSPGSMTFDTYANSYTLSGTGTIAGTGTLVKEGTASLTISNSGGNSFSGGAIINGGTVYMKNGSALGSGTTTLNGSDLEIDANISIGMPIAVNEPSTLGVDAGGSEFVSGAVSGAAPLALNFNAGGIVCSPGGSWVAYTGTLTVSGGGDLRLDNSAAWGFPNAVVNLDGAEALYNRSGGAAVIPIGTLNGVSSSVIGGSDQSSAAGTTATYVIGGLNLPSAFAGSIANSANQAVAITGTGTSTLTLTGSSTYTGPTTIWNTLLLTGSLGNTSVTINPGATFISNSIVSGTVTLDAGSSLYLGSSTAAGNIGTLTVGNNFTANAATIYYDLSSSPTATGSNDLITVTAGTLSLSGSVNFIINLTNGVLGAGTYNLINGGATLGVNGLSMVLDLPIPAGGVTRQTFAMIRPASGTNPGYIHLVVTNSAGALTWSGTSGATWDLDTTSGNWSGGTTSTFYDLDSVTFNDTDTGGSVILSGTLAPSVIYVSATATNYTFSGTGIIAGGTELVKTGAGTLTFADTTTNTFTGPVYLDAGEIIANGYNEMGTGTIYLNGGLLQLPSYPGSLANPIVVNVTSTIYGEDDSTFLGGSAALTSATGVTLYLAYSNNTLTMDGSMSGFQGTLELGTSLGILRLDNGGSALAVFDLGTSTAGLGNRNGGITDYFGAMEGGSRTSLLGRTAGSGDTISTYVVGGLNMNTTFAGAISNNGDLGGLNITKVGTGNWTLSGTSNFTGEVLIQQGTLTISGSDNNNGLVFETGSGAALNLVGGAITTDTVQIDPGGSFTGSGTINGNLVSEGTNSTTSVAGTVTVNGPLTVNGNFENDGTMTVASGGTLYFPLAISGSATWINNGTLDLRNSPQTVLPVGYINNGTILTSGSLLVLQGLVWNGDGVANAWNLSAANWISLITGSAAAFANQDPITFTDGGSTSPAINLSAGVAPASVEVSATGSNFTISGAGGIGGSGGLEEDSAGSLTLSTTNTYTGDTTVNTGSLFVTGGSIAGTGQILIGGGATGAAAAMYQSGASVVSNTNTALGAFALGTGVGMFGYYNLSAGTLNVGGEIDPGGPSGGAGTFGQFDMKGGTLNLPNQAGAYFLPNRGAAAEASVVNISGGTVQIAGGGAPVNTVINGLAANWSTSGTAQNTAITISGSGQFLTPSLTVKLNVADNTSNANVATLNLGGATGGGALQTLGFGGASGTPGNYDYNAILNFNGGTLEAGNAGNTTFLQGLAAAYLYGGGATINNNGQAITIGQVFQPPPGGGITGVLMTTAGSGYTVPPQVSFTGGSGSGATAYATINPTTGAVTGIVVTNPGIYYVSAPTATLTGTTPGTPAVPGAVSISSSNATTGGLTFAGAGTTTLTAIQTYTGPTVVNSGTLALNNTANTNGTLHGTSSLTINNGATVSLGGGDNSLFGAGSGGVLATINAGGVMTTTGSVTDHLGNLSLAGGTLASGTPSGDGLYYGEYNLDYGVTAGSTTTTSTISAQDVALTESGGTIFNVSPGASNGIDLYVTGKFYHSTGSPDTGLVKTGGGVMAIAGASNFSSATTVSAGTLEVVSGGSLATTGVTVSTGATLGLAGGSITTTGTVQVGTGAFLVGYGAINAALVNSGTTTVTGALALNGNVQNNGTLMVIGSGSLTVNLPANGTFVNNGLLDIMDSPQTVLPAGYVNNGAILTSSLVTVKSFSKSGNTFAVTIQTYSGHTYQLQKSPDLNGWQNVGTSQGGTGSAIVLSDTNSSSGSMFYQVAVGP
jgi:autotransporter-associated beta strand protein